MKGTGVLVDVFDVAGEGNVVLLEQWNGTANIKDVLTVGGSSYEIKGLELVSHQSLEGKNASIAKGQMSFLISDASKEIILEFKGQTVQIRQVD